MKIDFVLSEMDGNVIVLSKVINEIRLEQVALVAATNDKFVKAGGRIALFARGAQKGSEVSAGILGDLTTDKPFIGEVLDAAKANAVNAGINVSAKGEASVVMFYTPPG